MDEVRLIRDQINITYKGSSWHGPNMVQILDGLELDEVIAKQIGGRHSIWEIVNHIAFWINVVNRSLNGNYVSKGELKRDWPEIGTTQEDWILSVEKLHISINSLLDSLSDLSNEELEVMILDTNYNYRTVLQGILHHNLYHMGQISLLKKKR